MLSNSLSYNTQSDSNPLCRQPNTMFASILPKGMSSESLRQSPLQFHTHPVATTDHLNIVKMSRLDGVDVIITLLLSVILNVFVFAVYSYHVASGMQMWSCSHVEFHAAILQPKTKRHKWAGGIRFKLRSC